MGPEELSYRSILNYTHCRSEERRGDHFKTEDIDMIKIIYKIKFIYQMLSKSLSMLSPGVVFHLRLMDNLALKSYIYL